MVILFAKNEINKEYLSNKDSSDFLTVFLGFVWGLFAV